MTRLSGIEGGSQQAHDRSIVPLGVDGDVVYFTCDTIGGQGSKCPGLLSNHTFRDQRMNLLAAFFENGDGLLAWDYPLKNGKTKPKYVRVLLTDSGHYLLPIDQFSGYDGRSEF